MSTYTEQLATVAAAIAAAEAALAAGAYEERDVRFADGSGVRKRISSGQSLQVLYAERARLTPLAAREAAGRRGPRISRGAGW